MLRKIMKKVFNIMLVIIGIYLTILVCDCSANYVQLLNAGFDPNTASEWALERTERNFVKPVNDWLDEHLSSKESEVKIYPMVVQSIQGNTLVNEFKSGR